MYIGPWQEYKLGQAQARRASQGQGQSLGTTGPDIRADLQQTLLQTLSPEDVAKVMAAMNPLLNRENNDNSPVEKTALPPLPSSSRRHQQQYARGRHQRLSAAAERGQPTLQEQFKLPSVHSPKYRTAALSPGQNGTPQSVRSSKSEPLHSSRLPKRPKNNIRAFSPPVNSARGYDSSNLMATLRLERRSRPTLNDTAKKADFGQFWNWKGGDNKEGGIAIDTKKSKADNVIESKIAKVKNMHKLYASGQLDQYENNVDIPISVDIDSSPLRTYKKPQTPVVQDRDVTSTDLEVVSKYFKPPNPLGRSTQLEPIHTYKTPPKLFPIVSPPSSPPMEDEEVSAAKELSGSNIDQDSNSEISRDNNTGRIICSPVQVMDTGGNFGSPDGLLHWTTLLNPDEIDSMY